MARMSGAEGVMALIMLETAVGGSVVLWASGTWGQVRRGFFLLVGVTVTLCAAGAWAIAASGDTRGDVVPVLAGFTGLLALWQILLLARREFASKIAGLVAAAVGAYSLLQVAGLRPSPPAALAELVLGALFLGSTTHGLLLGHWYLVERRLTNKHMIRSSWFYIGGVVAAFGAALLSSRNPEPDVASLSPLLAVPGFTVLLASGLVAVCALISAFVWKLAKEGGRSIQAATGMFYLAVIMAFAAELSAKVRFFA